MELRKQIFRSFFFNILLLIFIGLASLASTTTLRNRVGQPSSEIFDDREFHHIFLWISFINSLLLVAGVLGSFWMGRRLTRKLNDSLGQLNEMASNVASGELSTRLPEMGLAELDTLAASLNRLVDNLAHADAEITREVEEKVFAEKKAVEAARSKSEFLAQVSHEFRTPLNGILGYTQVLLMDQSLSDKNRNIIQSLQRSGENLLELVNDVLDLSKIEARSMTIKQSRFYLADMLQSVAGSYAEQVRIKGLEFRMNLDQNLPEDILGDQVRLRQILVNLIGNAVKFTETGFIELRAKARGEQVRFEVEDSGVGIAPEDHERIFEPFVQAERGRTNKVQGTGLGLPISNRLLEIMGSKLEVESEPGKGSVFRFDLPQPDRKNRRFMVSAAKVTGYTGSKKKLVLLDPGRENGSLLTPLLRQTGFGVLETEDEEIALDGCTRMNADAILITHTPPQLEGIEVMKTLLDRCARSECSPPKVFILSAHHETGTRNAALSAGALEVLTSPLRFQDLLNVFSKHLKLEWTTEESPLTRRTRRRHTREALAQDDILPPPASMLRHCLFLARAGNVRKLKDTIDTLQKEHPEYNLFSGFVLDHCANYQMSPLVDWLEQRLISDNETTHAQ